jgi:hypothetical protein
VRFYFYQYLYELLRVFKASYDFQMCLTPSIVALSIAATRIHRGLVDYASVECTEQYDTTPFHSSLHSHSRRQFDSSHSKANGHAELKANIVPINVTVRMEVSRMEVAIPDMYEREETPQLSQHGSAGSLIDVEGQLYEMPARPGQPRPDENLENGVGLPT